MPRKRIILYRFLFFSVSSLHSKFYHFSTNTILYISTLLYTLKSSCFFQKHSRSLLTETTILLLTTFITIQAIFLLKFSRTSNWHFKLFIYIMIKIHTTILFLFPDYFACISIVFPHLLHQINIYTVFHIRPSISYMTNAHYSTNVTLKFIILHFIICCQDKITQEFIVNSFEIFKLLFDSREKTPMHLYLLLKTDCRLCNFSKMMH